MKHFLVIGLGSIGRRHSSNLALLYPGSQFTFVRHEGTENDFTRSLDARVVRELSETLDDTIDLAVLATPSANHIDALPALVDSGWPLLIEKPVVTDVSDCETIERLIRSAPAAVRAAGFNLRFVPSIRRMKDEIDSGSLGTIVRASFTAGQWLPDWRPGTDYRASYSADALRGGGVELDLSHEFDLARWFFGELDVDFCKGGTFSTLELASNDTVVAILSPRGASSPLITVTLDYVSSQRVRCYDAIGERGRIHWDIEGDLDLLTAQGTQSLVSDSINHDVNQSYINMIESVMSAIEGGDSSQFQTLEDGLASTRLALQVRDEGSIR